MQDMPPSMPPLRLSTGPLPLNTRVPTSSAMLVMVGYLADLVPSRPSGYSCSSDSVLRSFLLLSTLLLRWTSTTPPNSDPLDLLLTRLNSTGSPLVSSSLSPSEDGLLLLLSRTPPPL